MGLADARACRALAIAGTAHAGWRHAFAFKALVERSVDAVIGDGTQKANEKTGKAICF
jgi:hypothetical protein